MLDIRPVTDGFAVAPQIDPADMAAIKAAGFDRVICNRPDGEESAQPSHAALSDAAAEAGLEFILIPFSGRPGEAQVEAMADAIEAGGDARTLAFCRSGTRSVMAWAMSQIARGKLSAPEAIARAKDAGYNLG